MPRKIPFHRPMKLSEDEMKGVINKIDDCLSSGQITNKENVRELEKTMADYYDVKYAIATSSASQALLITLQVMDKMYNISKFPIYTPAFAWYSTYYAIASMNLRCSYVDIDIETWTMADIPYYNLALPVHTFGNVCNIDSEYLIYDGAHSLGSIIKDIGDATILSLAPTKIITSIEGGIVLTEEQGIAEGIVSIRDKVSRMSEIHAIFGNVFLSHIDEVIKFKKKVFDYYSSNLKGQFQRTAKGTNHNTIGMLTDLKIPDCIEIKKYYEPLGEGIKGSLINTKKVYDRMVCLPSYFDCPYERVVELINDFNKGE